MILAFVNIDKCKRKKLLPIFCIVHFALILLSILFSFFCKQFFAKKSTEGTREKQTENIKNDVRAKLFQTVYYIIQSVFVVAVLITLLFGNQNVYKIN